MEESTKERGEHLLKTLQHIDETNQKSSSFLRAREAAQEAEAVLTHKAVFWQQTEANLVAATTFDVNAWERARLDNNSRRVADFEKSASAITQDIDKAMNQLYDVALKDNDALTQAIINAKKNGKAWLEQKKQHNVQEMQAEVEKFKQNLVLRLEEDEREWEKLVATSRVVDQLWKKEKTPSIPLSTPQQELQPTGFLDTTPNHSFLEPSPSPRNSIQPTNAPILDNQRASTSSLNDQRSHSEPILDNQVVIREVETNKVLCTVQVEPGEPLAAIRARLGQISSEFRFLKPSGNPIALKMEGKTPLAPGQTSISISYVN